MKQKKYFLVIYLFVMLLMLFSVSCTPGNPVRYFKLFHTADGATPSFIPPSDITLPFPTDTMALSPGDKIFLFIALDEQFKGDITFSRITFFSKDTSEEVEIGHDLGPFTPGSFVDRTYTIPTQPGNYEVRIYITDKVVARALFEIN